MSRGPKRNTRPYPPVGLGVADRRSGSALLIAVDPGLRCPGACVGFVGPRGPDFGGALWGSPPARPGRTPDDAAAVLVEVVRDLVRGVVVEPPFDWVTIVEHPQKYPTQTAAHDDLDALVLMIECLPLHEWTEKADGHRPYRVLPRVWKGTIPKEIHHARIRRLLPPSRWGAWDEATHDARDAASLWAWAAGLVDAGGHRRDQGDT